MRGVYIAVLMAALIALTSVASAYETLKVTNVTADVSFDQSYAGITQGNTLTINIELPMSLADINATGGSDYLNVTADAATASTTVTVVVNGVTVANQVSIPGGSTQTWTFADFAAAGVDMSATYLNIQITANVNNTSGEQLVFSANDALLRDNFSVTVNETVVTTPVVDGSSYAVKDNVSITQDSDVNLTDVNATLSYPQHTLSKDVPSYYNFGGLNVSETKYFEVNYQKKPPFVDSVSTKATDGTYNVTAKIYSYENLTAEIQIDVYSSDWSKYFPGYRSGALTAAYLNGNKISLSEENGKISGTLDLVKGYNTLVIEFYKTEVAAAPPIVPVGIEIEVPWYLKEFLGVPMWVWIMVGVMLVAALVISARKG